MKLLQVAMAYMALDKIAAQELPLSISYQVMRIQNAMNDSYNFYLIKEDELLRKYPPDEIRGSRAFFKDSETWEKYEREHDEMDSIDADVHFHQIRLKSTDPVKLTAEALKTLTDAGVIVIDGEPECDCGKE